MLKAAFTDIMASVLTQSPIRVPVSYTHLDVYKRQIYARLVEGEDGAHNLIWSRSKGD